MSKYTTEVRYICETVAGVNESAGYSRVDDIINKAIPVVFDFDFPIFDVSYRNVLCKKILKHYYTREICEETVGLWKFRLDTRMNEIMPYFNQLYKSELLEFNPLYDVDVTRTANRKNTAEGTETLTSSRTGASNSEYEGTNTVTSSSTGSQTSEGSSQGTNSSTSKTTTSGESESANESTTTAKTTSNSTGRDLYSDTPQGALTNVDNETYLTNARKQIGDTTKTDNGSATGSTTATNSSEDNTTASGTDNTTTTGQVDTTNSGESNQTTSNTANFTNSENTNSNQLKNAESTEDYLESVSGKHGGATYSKMLMEYRKTFLNIDMQVIDSLSDLFFGLW